MRLASKFALIVLLFTAVVSLEACSGGDGAPLGGATSSSASMRSKKFWDRCNNGECPPMDADDRPQKPRPE